MDKKIKVLLIMPRVSSAMEIFEKPAGITVPLGIAYIAAYMKKSGFDNVFAIDDWIEKLSREQMIERIRNIAPDVVGINATTPTLSNALKIAGLVKEVNPETIVVMGGPHAGLFPKDMLENPAIDIVVVGEGEVTMSELVDRLSRKVSYEDVKGIHYKKNGRYLSTPARELIKDLDSIPFPARELFKMDKYFLPVTRKKIDARGDIVMVNRGCPQRCAFCAKPIFKNTVRSRSAANVLSEIEYLMREYGVREILFQDNNFSVNRKLAVTICNLIIEKKLNINWTSQARVDTVDEDLLKLFKRSGCELLTFGIESGNQQILDRIKKDITLEQARKAIGLCKKYKIDLVCNFMIGNPGETADTVRDTINFAKELDPDFANFFILVPNPGSEIYNQALDRGLIDAKNFDDYITTSTKLPVIEMCELSKREMAALQKKAFREFYTRPSNILKRIIKIRSREAIKRLFIGGWAVIKHQIYSYKD